MWFCCHRYAQWAKLHGPEKPKSIQDWARKARGEQTEEEQKKKEYRTLLRARPSVRFIFFFMGL
eukprot:SAG22_NODE_14640_length_369_cov_0.766667_1_plen_63_part_01